MDAYSLAKSIILLTGKMHNVLNLFSVLLRGIVWETSQITLRDYSEGTGASIHVNFLVGKYI